MPNKPHSETSGLIIALGSMCVYGFFPVFAHYFVQELDPLLFAGITAFIGSLPLVGALKISGNLKDLYARNLIRPLLLIAALTTIGTIFFFLGTKITSAINTGLLEQAEPVYSVVLSVIFFKERPKVRQSVATLLMIAGAIVVVYKGMAPLNLGDVMILIAPFFYQCAHLVAKVIIGKVSDVIVVPAGRLFYGGIALTILALILHPHASHELTSLTNWAKYIFFALIFRSLDMCLWYQAMKRLPLSKLSALLPISAGVSFLGSVLWLKETAYAQQYLGLLLIIGGLLVISFNNTKRLEPNALKPDD